MSDGPRPESEGRSAYDDVLARALPQLRCFVRRRLGRRLLARESESDVVQSACRAVFEDLAASGIDSGELRRRLFAEATRKAIDHGRRHAAGRRAVERERELDSATPRAASGPTPSDLAALRDDLDRVIRALEHLSQADRDVVVLAVMLDLPHAEVARHLKTTVTATRTRLCRALARLALHLGEEG